MASYVEGCDFRLHAVVSQPIRPVCVKHVVSRFGDEARLCETLPKTDRYDFMRLDTSGTLVSGVEKIHLDRYSSASYTRSGLRVTLSVGFVMLLFSKLSCFGVLFVAAALW